MKAFAIAALAAALSFAGSAHAAHGYMVNDHAASPTEVQVLASYAAQPGKWTQNGFGISRAAAEAESVSIPTVTKIDGKKCWYVLDELLCD